jgi:hypothetical protein
VQITDLSVVFWVVSGCSTAVSTALVMAATFCVRTTGRAVAILILLPYLAAFGGLQAAYVYYMCNHRGWRCFSAALPVGLAGELQNLPAASKTGCSRSFASVDLWLLKQQLQ